MMKTKIFYLIITMLLFLAARAQFNGDQDSTFGTDGVALLSNQNYETQGLRAIYGTDNKLYVASNSGGQNVDILLSRFNADGTIDNTFGNNGKVVFNPSIVGNDIVQDIKLGSGNKIIVTGYSDFGAPQNEQALVARFNTNGTLDISFNQTGVAIMGNNHVDVWFSCALEPNGDIIVAGALSDAQGNNLTTAKYKANGNLDSTYGYNGVSTLDISDNEHFYRIVRKNSNLYYLLAEIDDEAQVLAIDSSGDLDYSFGGNGKVSFNVLAGFELKPSSLLLDGSNLFFAGKAENEQTNKYDVFAAKMNGSGSFVQSFGFNGIYRADLGGGNHDEASDLTLLSDGSLLLSGSAKNASSITQMATFMLASDGTLAAGYGTLGVKRYFTTGNESSAAASLAVDAQGKVVLCGSKQVANQMKGVLVKLKSESSGIGINETLHEQSFATVYPNPMKESLFIEVESSGLGELHLEIIDLNGRMLSNFKTQVFVGNQKIDLSSAISHLPLGTYILQIKLGHKTEVQKLIKQ